MLVLVVPAVLMRINKTFAIRADCWMSSILYAVPRHVLSAMDLPGKSGEHQLRNQEVFYGKREWPTPEFRREAVRLALTSGRTRRKINTFSPSGAARHVRR